MNNQTNRETGIFSKNRSDTIILTNARAKKIKENGILIKLKNTKGSVRMPVAGGDTVFLGRRYYCEEVEKVESLLNCKFDGKGHFKQKEIK